MGDCLGVREAGPRVKLSLLRALDVQGFVVMLYFAQRDACSIQAEDLMFLQKSLEIACDLEMSVMGIALCLTSWLGALIDMSKWE